MLSVLRSEVSAHVLLGEGLMKTEAVTLLRWGFCMLCNSTVLSFGSQIASTARPEVTTRNSRVLSVLFAGLTCWKVEHSLECSGKNGQLCCLSYAFFVPVVLGLLSLIYCFDFDNR